MQNQSDPKLAKWPFLVGDGFLLGTAYFISVASKMPIGTWQTCLLILCVAGGACLSILPFVLEFRISGRLAEANALTTAAAQMGNLEKIAAQISGATGRWQTAQEEAEKVAGAAKKIAERMEAEVRAFTDFLQRVNDSEKATLKLEVEKLRRAENDWLQVLVRMLDHVYALHLGAVRSGQPSLIEQLSQFQNACRDAARRVGLAPFAANPAEPFDAGRHQVLEGNGKPAPGASVAETVATGYTFQGRMLRPALVRLQERSEEPQPETELIETGLKSTDSNVPLEAPAPKST